MTPTPEDILNGFLAGAVTPAQVFAYFREQLRDDFAIAAMPHCLASMCPTGDLQPGETPTMRKARMAFEIADAMLAARSAP